MHITRPGIVLVGLLAGGVAVAQPSPPSPPAEPAPDAPPAAPQDPDPRGAEVPPAEMPTAPVAATAHASAAVASAQGAGPAPVAPSPAAAPVVPPPERLRPSQFSVGVGIGYLFPANLLEPNVSTVRLRFPSGLTVEPGLALLRNRSSSGLDAGGGPPEDAASLLLATAIVRYPLRTRGRVDLDALAAAAVEVLSERPVGADNDTTNTTLALGWGLGLTYWASSHWAFSVTGSNPFISYTKETQQLGGVDTIEKQTSLGLVFAPRILIAAHLFL